MSRGRGTEDFTGVQDRTNTVSPAGRRTLTSAVLTYAGALPFLACALLPYAGVDHIPLSGSAGQVSVSQILVTYGLAIASFMAGTLWAVGLREPGGSVPPLLPLSNALVLAVWISALAAPPAAALAVQAVVFVLLLWADGRLFAAGFIGRGYWQLRQHISVIVVLALLLGMYSAWPE